MRARFNGNLRAPAGARTFVTQQLGTVLADGAESWSADVVLVVSELVTNSVRAGAGTIDVDLHADATQIDLRVADDAPGWPEPRTAGQDELNGRGLAIVEQLADRWTATERSPGKTVTATWFRSR